MLNTKLYKSVHTLAEQLVEAADKADRETFDALYTELKAICIENENTEKDHPVQWETLADFTEEVDDAIAIYEKALGKAEAINEKDYMASIAYSIATLQLELGENKKAIKYLEEAKINANKSEDLELKADIDQLLVSAVLHADSQDNEG
ncbi:tetratricopeptide repeat protein [Neptunomonas phycophila]|uniref:Tetratricopeptide repeat protein n=1 Tax=Neptunomonas phycophila TaxID=1572645 RepID=A0ABT9EZB8_9GAMM|nr:tetratricopeptide repeat protein [Neptunomonas phycophila]MBT3145009.1 tetratricopeptide repeat protein [Neptunomonas phycophila]MDO6785939.1 tetratricopeptide repeat protein [Neptunomonas phycophila]MDP2524397.1 tetratricopeptide repeat protein [Neptunomonas phycophila]